MATTIVLKNSVTTTNAPSSLTQGEVAVNVTDKKVWVGNAATTPIQLLGSGADGVFSSVTDTGLTNTRVTYAGTGGLLKDSANITTDGTTLTAAGFSGPHNGTVGATTPAAGTFTTLTASSTLSFASQSIPFAALPTGSVLQVVTFTTTTGTSTTSNAFVATGLTASITPKFSTSKIYIVASFNLNVAGSAVWGDFTLYKNSTNLGATNGFGGVFVQGAPDNHIPCALNYLDSPATTSSVTYKIYIKNRDNATLIRLDPDSQTSVITIMEIAA